MPRALFVALTLGTLTACGTDTATAPAPTSAAVKATPRPPKAKVTPTVAASPEPAPSRDPSAPRFEPLGLLPADTLAVLRVASMASVEEAALKIGAISERAGTPLGLRDGLMLAFAQAGVEWNKIRTDEPIVVAVRMPKGADQPDVIVYAPVSYASPVQSGATRQTEVDGDYLAISMGAAPPPPARPKWCEGLDDGDELVRARIDVRGIVRQFGPALPVLLANAMPSGGGSPELDAELERSRAELLALAASARALDLAIDLDEGRLTVASELEIEGGPLAAQVSQRGNVLQALARHLAGDAPIACAMAFDVENAAQVGAEELEASLAALPPPMRDIAASLQRSAVELLAEFEPGAAALVDPSPGSVHAAFVLQAKNPTRAREALGELLGTFDFDSLGFDLSLPVRSRIGNAVVENFTFRFDTRRLDFDARSEMRSAFEAFLGDANLHLVVATSGKEMLFLLGGDTVATQARIRAFTATLATPIDLSGGLASIGATNPAAVWRIDATRLLTLPAEFAAAAQGESAAAARREALRAAPGLGPVPVVLWGGARTDRAFGGLEVDLDDLERAMALLGGR